MWTRSLVLRSMMIVAYAILLIPIVIVVGTSLGRSALFEFPPRQLSFHWFESFLSKPALVHSFFGVSLLIALLSACLALLIAAPAALALVRFRFRGRAALETFFTLPVAVPHILLGVALYLFYVRLRVEASLLTLLLGHVLIALPYVIRSVTAGLAGLDPRLEEAAMSLGASQVAAFFKVSFPLIRSSIVSGAVFAFIVSFGDVNLALFLAGPGSTTLPVHIFSEIQWGADPTIAAASTLQILVVGLLLFLLHHFFRLRLGI